MENQEMCNILWDEIVVDFGHELITAVHTPIAWSDQRPGEDEFKESFSKAKLEAGRILSFIGQRKSSLKRVVLMNSEGYYSEVSQPRTLEILVFFGMSTSLLANCVRATSRANFATAVCANLGDLNAPHEDLKHGARNAAVTETPLNVFTVFPGW